MNRRALVKSDLLPWEDIRPIVELAGYYAFEQADTTHHYRNPAHHLILVNNGRVDYDAPDGQSSAQSGDLICFRPAERNRYIARAPTSFYQAVIEFAPPPRHRATPVWDDVGPLPIKISLGDQLPAMRRQFETLCIELPRVGSAHQMRVRAAVFEILAIIAMQARSGRTEIVVHDDPWLRTRLALEMQLANEVRVDRLAREMGLSVNHFIRKFSGHFGVTPKAYHTRLRLREGARMLRQGDRSVKAIAFALGFSDSKAFARRFRHHFGVNPSDVRTDPPDDARSESTHAAPIQNDLLYNVNHHVLPPDAGVDYLHRYLAPTEG
jgi:AraC-like DNA-binding protein